LYFFRIQETAWPPRLEKVIRYSSFSTTVVVSEAATTASADALAEAAPAALRAEPGGTAEAGLIGSLDVEVEATSAGVSGCVFFFGPKYCKPRKIKTKTMEKMRSVRESCPPPPG
jgi:hypothetical protein